MPKYWATFGLDLHVEVDPASGRRAGLEHALRDAIRDGRLAPRTLLPSTRALAAETGLSRNTVSAAYDQLVAEGYLTARRGSGTSVADVTATPAEAPRSRGDAVAPRHDLRPGRPDVTTFPSAAWMRSTRRVLGTASPSVYGYGDPRGAPELRAALAAHLGRTRGVLATADQIVVTSGAVQALSLLARVVGAGPKPEVAMEDPGLRFHREVVRRAGARVLPLPVDGRGARTDLLGGDAYAEAGAVVVTPAHQYPSGVTLHPSRRHALADWARGGGGLVVEDDYDGEFRYDRQPVGALQGMAPEHVAYLGTASKTLGPGLRLAWLVLPRHLVGPVVDAKRHADHHTESLGQLVLADLITSHAYDRHVRACRLRYRRRRDLLVSRLAPAAVQDAAPLALQAVPSALQAVPLALQGMAPVFEGSAPVAVQGVAAGLHAMVTLPPGGPDEAAVLAACAARGVAVQGLAGHWHAPDDAPGRPQGLIVGYGTPTEAAYPAALDALVAALRA
ncbi:PLP-dependent aminotransferase family protein [Sphaerisporangium album]|uniref:PLP-dependent aminotransferase family protein n=1 Tax=Sphaerisporangium album TaxID=509200 RepID=A0A367FIH0_9ACTN|nr:PLP-dependent aminotransferase family protein [Sphaerisporangium album]RCG30183.1 PLP-dependent aminotransferase family protein [Sphaerisporangium album]